MVSSGHGVTVRAVLVLVLVLVLALFQLTFAGVERYSSPPLDKSRRTFLDFAIPATLFSSTPIVGKASSMVQARIDSHMTMTRLSGRRSSFVVDSGTLLDKWEDLDDYWASVSIQIDGVSIALDETTPLQGLDDSGLTVLVTRQRVDAFDAGGDGVDSEIRVRLQVPPCRPNALPDLGPSSLRCRFSDFSGLDLRNTDWRGADIRLAQFDSSDLRGARFDGADATGVVVAGAILDATGLGAANTTGIVGAGG
jgi:hypothetical protein